MGSCLDYFNAGYESGSYYIKPDGYRKGSMCVFCNMTLEGGGWTLVYRYGFNNYDDFTASSNYVSHIPTCVSLLVRLFAVDAFDRSIPQRCTLFSFCLATMELLRATVCTRWQDHDNWPESYTLEALESKVAPRTEEEFGAMDFGYWKLLGEEFIVASNINSWVRLDIELLALVLERNAFLSRLIAIMVTGRSVADHPMNLGTRAEV